MVPKYNFNKISKTILPGREQWKDSSRDKATLHWYTYGWKRRQEGGNQCTPSKETVFPADTIVIRHCVTRIPSSEQAVIKALDTTKITSWLVWDWT